MSAFRRWIRRRPWWQRIILGLLISFVVFAIGRWISWEYTYAQGEKELAEAIAETDRLDPRWRWEQIEEDREKVPDEENSILVVNEVYEHIKKWNESVIKLPDGDTLIGKWQIDWPPNQQLDDSRRDGIQQALAQRADMVKLALRLKDLPRGKAVVHLKPNSMATHIPHGIQVRSTVAVFDFELERLIADRNWSEAVDRVYAILNLGAGLRNDYFSICQLIRVAIRIQAVKRIERLLAMGQPSGPALKELASHMSQEADEDLLTPAFRGERALISVLFENLITGRLSFEEFVTETGGASSDVNSLSRILGWRFYSAKLPADHAYFLRSLNTALEIAKLPEHEQLPRYRDFCTRFSADANEARQRHERILSTLLVPGVDKLAESIIRDKALLRCAITALAAERYRIDTNAWPKSLADLCPKYMNEPLLDPFDGQPLKYVNRDDGVTIYSVGADGIDGSAKNLTASGREPGADLGFRLWNVDQRGLPAKVKGDDANDP